MAQPYVYRPLESLSTIRLIKILPEKVDDCVACFISHFELSEAPAYTALSYCWGDPTPTGNIHIGDEPGTMHARPLHENLLRFVESMWSQEEFSTYFWTDSLCLDQENNQEKGHQVKRMGRIYASAAETLIWLGHEQETFENMNAIACYLRPPKANVLYRYRSLQQILSFVSKLSFVQYWRRTWVVQEVALSCRPILASRELRVHLDDYNKFFTSLGIEGRPYDRRAEEISRLRQSRHRTSLWDLLTVLKEDRECTRAIDRVYSLLGLASDDFDGDHISELLEVDYDKTPVQVFWDTIFECKPGIGSQSRSPSLHLQLLRSLVATHGHGVIYDSLKHYTHSFQSLSNRKQRFGSTALQVCDAISIYNRKYTKISHFYRVFYRLVLATLHLHLSHTQYSAFVGLAISADEEGQNNENTVRPWLTLIRNTNAEIPIPRSGSSDSRVAEPTLSRIV